MENPKNSKILRAVLFIFYLMTVLFTLVSGGGTYCAAFDTEKYPAFASLIPYQSIYQVVCVISIAIGLWGLWVTVSFVRSKSNVFRDIIIVLSIGLVAAATQMITSEIARGASAPVNIRVYFTLFTLLLFLIVRYTSLWQQSGFNQSNNKESLGKSPVASALMLGGIMILTTHIWVGDTHFAANGYNWVNDFSLALNLSGLGMLFSGGSIFITSIIRKIKGSKEAVYLAKELVNSEQN